MEVTSEKVSFYRGRISSLINDHEDHRVEKATMSHLILSETLCREVTNYRLCCEGHSIREPIFELISCYLAKCKIIISKNYKKQVKSSNFAIREMFTMVFFGNLSFFYFYLESILRLRVVIRFHRRTPKYAKLDLSAYVCILQVIPYQTQAVLVLKGY